jgi:DNA-binding transcriptional LysR family regulator
MDTKQLAAFCAVVERRSFSQAADQLGVTQPAVSLQIRSLEQRIGQQLLDRSGRRVEPTEAGLKLYRSSQRLLALEQQMLAELGEEAKGELTGRLEIGASTGPGGSVLPALLGEWWSRWGGASSSSGSSGRGAATAASRSSRSTGTRWCSPSRPGTAAPARPSASRS